MNLHEAKYDQADSGAEFLPLDLMLLNNFESPDVNSSVDASIFNAGVFPMPFFVFGDSDEDDFEDDFDDMEEEDFDDDEDEDFDEDEDDDDYDDDDDDDDDDYDYDDEDDDDFEYDDE